MPRDGIFRERREHARGRYLADCRRICGSSRESFGSIEEMWKKQAGAELCQAQDSLG